jgi:hypothetical protein
VRACTDAAKAAPFEDLNYLTLESIASLLGVRSYDRRLMGWVTILIDAKLLEQRAQYVDLGDDVYEFDQQGYRAALEAGAFIDPASGREVADTSLLAPYWAVSASLAA